jgi:hypothetical protein
MVYNTTCKTAVEKGLVCNIKGPICKDLTVEINSIRLAFLAVVR